MPLSPHSLQLCQDYVPTKNHVGAHVICVSLEVDGALVHVIVDLLTVDVIASDSKIYRAPRDDIALFLFIADLNDCQASVDIFQRRLQVESVANVNKFTADKDRIRYHLRFLRNLSPAHFGLGEYSDFDVGVAVLGEVHNAQFTKPETHVSSSCDLCRGSLERRQIVNGDRAHISNAIDGSTAHAVHGRPTVATLNLDIRALLH
mmetsp:Transcript_2335/g.4814  ORF Transcript_2335/g.4814 Transcript_2335/m.4814 type:complete len:204 (+) Transcript_2335:74-685(+)